VVRNAVGLGAGAAAMRSRAGRGRRFFSIGVSRHLGSVVLSLSKDGSNG
jgi:hypothetical protein